MKIIEGLDLQGKAAEAQASLTQESRPEPSAVEQLEAAQTPHKKDIAAAAPELLSPAAIQMMSALVQAAVKEAMTSVTSTMERLNQPSAKEKQEIEDIENFKLRMKREKAQGFEQDATNRLNLKNKQDHCAHRDQNEKSAISLIHNMPSRQVAGICVICQKIIQGGHYELAPPGRTGILSLAEAEKFIESLVKEGVTGVKPYVNPKSGRVTHFLMPPDREYQRVLDQEAKMGLGVSQ